MRIVTRPDFDGIVSAVLLYEVENITEPVLWTEPAEIQKRMIPIKENDIVCNLPFHENCAMWFDHHYTNEVNHPFTGSFRIAPSAAGVIFEYYSDRFLNRYSRLVHAADRIDSADLSRDEVEKPENHPYILLSHTLAGNEKTEYPYWNHMVETLRKTPDEEEFIKDSILHTRMDQAIKQNLVFREHLLKNTRVEGPVSITDFRAFKTPPHGNRFLVYSLFPDTVANMKIRILGKNRDMVAVNVGHSIFNPHCNVNAGVLLARFEGGGHKGAAACRFHVSKMEDYLPEIIRTLVENKPNTT